MWKQLLVGLSLVLSFSSSEAWTTTGGHIFDNDGNQVALKGISWFGFETQDFVINGLWTHPMDFYMDTLQEQGFNMLRVPFSSEWILKNFDLYPYDGNIGADPENQHRKAIEVLDTLFDMAEERGILIMLDLHRLHNGYISELWYSPTDQEYTEETFFTTWFRILDRYQERPNLFAVDLLNEPHGRATWGTGDPATDWKKFAETAIPRFVQQYPNSTWLFLVEGTGWGTVLGGPIDVPEATNRVVYSAHCYGASVVWNLDVYDVEGLHALWDKNYGYMRDRGFTVVLGEWGGKSLDIPFMKTFSEYLISKDMRDNFFWSLGPNSGDVGGLLTDDWTTIEQYKMDFINAIQPTPTVFKFK